MWKNQLYPESIFLSHADQSLNSMKIKAQKMKIKGVGMVAYYNCKSESWTSKMSIMGALKNDAANFLSIAYSKAGEMIVTLQNSGTTDRIPLLGEYNFLGGVIEKIEDDYVIAVFSGATGEEDTIVAQHGLDFMVSKINTK